jgi:predicted transport protein
MAVLPSAAQRTVAQVTGLRNKGVEADEAWHRREGPRGLLAYPPCSTGRSGVEDPRGSAGSKGPMSWTCPRCDRAFRQVNQRHACGVGSAATLLKGRAPALAELYRRLETTVKSFGEVEVVTRDRYALFRTTRIFADLTVTRDALRVVVHLGRKVSAPYFIKVGPSGNRVSHVVLVRTAEDLRAIMPFLREAFDLAVGEA